MAVDYNHHQQNNYLTLVDDKEKGIEMQSKRYLQYESVLHCQHQNTHHNLP